MEEAIKSTFKTISKSLFFVFADFIFMISSAFVFPSLSVVK